MRKAPGPPPGAFLTSGAREHGEQLGARALAATAFLGAQAAVLVVVRVALALLGGRPARRQAGLQRRPLGLGVGVGLAAEDAAGVDARIGAVEAEASAADQRDDVVLGDG